MNARLNVILGTFLLSASLGAMAESAGAAYDCADIDATTQETYEDLRNLGRLEVGKPPEEGGAFETPRQASDASCSPLIALAYASFTTLSEQYINRETSFQAKALLQLWANKACGELDDERSKVVNRILMQID